MLDPRLGDKLCSGDVLIATPGPFSGARPELDVWATVGAAVVLDKPLVLLVPDGELVPARLTALADAVVRYPAGGDPLEAPGLAEALSAARVPAGPLPTEPPTPARARRAAPGAA